MDTFNERHKSALSPAQFGFTQGQLVQEFGWDEDVSEELRQDLMDILDEDLLDEDYTGTCDGALLWWRASDGDSDDLSDALTDASVNLDEGGIIWVLTPLEKEERVDAQVIQQAAKTAGLNTTKTGLLPPDWYATRIKTRSK